MVQFVDKVSAGKAVDGFLSALVDRDISRLVAFTSDDFSLWNNCSQKGLNKAAAIDYLGTLLQSVRNYRIEQVQRLYSPTGIVQQHRFSFDTDLGSLENIPMLMIFTTRGELVTKCEEYYDSTGLPSGRAS